MDNAQVDDRTSAYIVRRVGTTGHEILNIDGHVVAWAIDKRWANLIAQLLDQADIGSKI